jgi:hypothetical protein
MQRYYADPASAAAKHRRNTYNLNAAAFDAMVKAQGNRCAICQDDMGVGKNRHIDHCHRTGRVRELLCNACNTTLGHMKESVELLLAMVDYIERHASRASEA